MHLDIKMSNSDNCINHKIDLVEINCNNTSNNILENNSINLIENKDELLKLKLKLYTRGCFNTKPKWQDIYNYHKNRACAPWSDARPFVIDCDFSLETV